MTPIAVLLVPTVAISAGVHYWAVNAEPALRGRYAGHRTEVEPGYGRCDVAPLELDTGSTGGDEASPPMDRAAGAVGTKMRFGDEVAVSRTGVDGAGAGTVGVGVVTVTGDGLVGAAVAAALGRAVAAGRFATSEAAAIAKTALGKADPLTKSGSVRAGGGRLGPEPVALGGEPRADGGWLLLGCADPAGLVPAGVEGAGAAAERALACSVGGRLLPRKCGTRSTKSAPTTASSRQATSSGVAFRARSRVRLRACRRRGAGCCTGVRMGKRGALGGGTKARAS